VSAPAETPAAGADPPKKKSKRGLLLVIVGLVAVLAGGGGAGWFFFLRPKGPAPAKQEEVHKAPEHILKAGTLVVNIAGTEGRRYLRTTLEVGTAPKQAKHVEELRPLLLDAANTILGTKDLGELLEPEQREHLKEELRERLNEAIGGPKPVITHVLLSEFVIQ
jgi:flagellar FliL protein